jgi:tetratricopeptide (TPR) repeat protein
MTTSSPAPGEVVAGNDPSPVGEARDPDLILARVHLLLGSLSLARTELETLAGRGALDDEAIRDLAEARWRTGDVAGAGEAAVAWLEAHPDDILGLVIAAEAQAALGRPAEARRLAGRALERANGSLDPVFAGMQRSQIWPVEAGSGVGPVGVLFDDLHPGPHLVPPLGAGGLDGAHGAAAGTARADPHGPFEPGVPAALATGPSLWGDDAAGMDAASDDALDPATLFHRARAALEDGQTAEAATGLILALRALPGLAPAILDLLAGRGEPILTLVRGDAQRIVGREVEAMRDHAVAAGGVSRGVSDTPAEPAGEAEPVADRDPEPGPDAATEPPTPIPDQENP